MQHWALWSVIGALTLVPVQVGASDTVPELTGRQIAEGLCAECHSIERTGDSPNTGAPPLRTLEQKWPLEFLEEALAEGIVVGHGGAEMPEYTLEAHEIGALLGYLETIQVPATE
ncbi:MAG: c-type cytochrome [Pseudomonadota bacterium]